MTPGSIIALALLFVAVEMALTFAVARRLNNFGIVDVVWSAGFSGLAILYYLTAPHVAFPSGLIRDEVLTSLAVLWSLRLGFHLAVRVWKHHPVEDVRYARLRELWGDRTHWRMFGFFQVQGLLQAILSMPFLLVCLNGEAPNPSWAGLSPLEWSGVALWLVALCGESIADLQLSRFRNDPANRGRVCQVRIVVLVAASQLFLRVAALVDLRRLQRAPLGDPLGSAGAPRDVVVPQSRHRHSTDRGPGSQVPR